MMPIVCGFSSTGPPTSSAACWPAVFAFSARSPEPARMPSPFVLVPALLAEDSSSESLPQPATANAAASSTAIMTAGTPVRRLELPRMPFLLFSSRPTRPTGRTVRFDC